MTKMVKITKWLIITILIIAILGLSYIRFSRYSDQIIYQMNGAKYEKFETSFNHEEFFFDVDDNVKLHGVLFKPDSIEPIATIFNYSGKGMNSMSISAQTKPLLEKGFQVFNFERRNFGQSTGIANNTLTLRDDALFVFDEVLKLENVKDLPVIIWGQSLGGTFATMNAAARQDKIKGLVLEGTFSSFPDIGKVYAHALNLENFKWLVPIIMNDDFPVQEEIKKLTIPVLVIHSKFDKEVPYELGKKIYESSNKANTHFWEINSKHIRGMLKFEKLYVAIFQNMAKKQ